LSGARTSSAPYNGRMRQMGALPVDFALEDENGRAWRLSEHLGDSVVLLFLRGDW